MRKSILALLIVSCSFALFGCGDKNDNSASSSEVVVTTSDVSEVVDSVASNEYKIGDKINIENKTPFSFMAKFNYENAVQIDIKDISIELTGINTLEEIQNDINKTSKYEWTLFIDGTAPVEYAGADFAIYFALNGNYCYGGHGTIGDDGKIILDNPIIYDIKEDSLYISSMTLSKVEY